ncbi:SWIM zinc finger family protein [Agitococcus lubricus]|uniref:SWIM-type domain-containing protein n=1 Tax=Agitococcus lubricus TaxID=1077255 RepID=A0A2T5J3X7_9GAMM|nr:SWIM zinc finger family protein [Agitococcus lubricus]PTQ91301.1 hypothetical protein C8N29_101374 [Agitococcus lubricus]
MDKPQLSAEQALQYAPDDSSIKAAKKLAAATQWQQLQLHTREQSFPILAGEIKGSALYQSAIFLGDKFSFYCNCPSFKRPCKHGLALLLCYAQSAEAFQQQAIPDWLNQHLRKFEASQQKKQEKAATSVKVVDEAAQAKRAAAREQKVQAALNELQQWLSDLIKVGLGQAKTWHYREFERIKTRLIDGQASGLVVYIDDLVSALAHSEWQSRASLHVGKIQLILSAYQQKQHLALALQHDLRTVIGWNTPQEHVLAGALAEETWLVLGQRELEGQNNIRYRRQWLWGLTQQRPALVLQFAAGFMPLVPALPTMAEFRSEFAWYGSAWPQRIALQSPQAIERQPLRHALGFNTLEEALHQQAQALAANPFLSIFPMLLHQVVPYQQQGQWYIVDSTGHALPLQAPRDKWQLLALSGGHPICVFGEWDANVLTLLSAWSGQEFIEL